MLGDHLGCVDGVIVTPESQFKIPAMKIFEGEGAEAAISYVKKDLRFKHWGSSIDESRARRSKSAEDFIFTIVDGYAKKNGVDSWNVWVDHTPSNISDWNEIVSSFTSAKLVHVIRDGRAVAASVLPLPWGPNNIVHAADWWRINIVTGLALTSCWPGDIIQIKYEDVVATPEAAFRELLSFLEMEYSNQVLEGGGFKVPEYTKKQHGKVGRGVDNSSVMAWKEKLRGGEIGIFEYYSGPTLAALGYEISDAGRKKPRKIDLMRLGEWPISIRYNFLKIITHYIMKWSAANRVRKEE